MLWVRLIQNPDGAIFDRNGGTRIAEAGRRKQSFHVPRPIRASDGVQLGAAENELRNLQFLGRQRLQAAVAPGEYLIDVEQRRLLSFTGFTNCQTTNLDSLTL